MTGKKFRNISAIAMCAAVFVMASTPADARRGGSMGSRGSRTYEAPPATRTAPNQAAPVQRSAADRPAQTQQGAANTRQAAAAPAKSGGLTKGLMGGLLAGGLIGMLMGGGLGALGGSGMLMALLQVALIGGLIWLALRLFRRRPAMAPAGGPGMAPFNASPFMGGQQGGSFAASQPQPQPQPQRFATPVPQSRDLAIQLSDKEDFERLLAEVQDAFGNEDYGRLRACTTPEVMSYLAEELSQNATQGLRNEVSQTELLEAEVAEAWSENGADYATIAMQYRSIDVMRDRSTGAVLEGDPTRPSHTTELWTFVRDANNPWRLSAIQEA